MNLGKITAVLSVESCGLFSRMFWSIKKILINCYSAEKLFLGVELIGASVLPLLVSMLLLLSVEIVSC